MDETNSKIEAYYLLAVCPSHLCPEKNHRLRMPTRVFSEAIGMTA
jgi:hypothetical protein